MSGNKQSEIEAGSGGPGLAAGDFSAWLHATDTLLWPGEGGTIVPCGTCRGCCRSSMFVHIKPEETQTIQRIPRALLFPAPGRPKGHVLMGYDEKGCCPMLVEGECSIYDDRPQTCRDYDCRVFAATGIQVDERMQPEIARRVKEWVFHYESEESRQEHGMVRKAAAFLEKNRDLFPQRCLPGYPVQLAALAVRVYRLFSAGTAEMVNDPPAMGDAAIAQAIMSAMSEPVTG
jgi:Fe-S-cluster containining protein